MNLFELFSINSTTGISKIVPFGAKKIRHVSLFFCHKISISWFWIWPLTFQKSNDRAYQTLFQTIFFNRVRPALERRGCCWHIQKIDLNLINNIHRECFHFLHWKYLGPTQNYKKAMRFAEKVRIGPTLDKYWKLREKEKGKWWLTVAANQMFASDI